MRLSERGSDASDDAATGLPQPPPPPPPPLTTPGGRGGSGSDNGAPISPHYDAGAADGSRATSPKLQGSDSKATSVDPSTRSEADASEVSSGSGSGGGAPISPHYDAARDVVLRLEFLRPAEVKVSSCGRHQRGLDRRHWRPLILLLLLTLPAAA